MEKIHLIGWALLITLFTASAITAMVSTVQEAQSKLGTTQTPIENGCYIHSITKQATTQNEITSNEWIVSYEFAYILDGQSFGEEKQAMVKDNTEAAVKAVIAPLCDQEWARVKAESGTIDKVIINIGAETNDVLNQVYKATTKTWGSLTAES